MNGTPLLFVRGLEKRFELRRGWRGAGEEIRAVDGVDLELRQGEVLGLVGESGSGKSTLGRCVLRLAEPSRGLVRFDGRELRLLGRRELRQARRRMQIVFQDPFGSLDPRMPVGETVAEPLRTHGIVSRAGVGGRVEELLERVGIETHFARRYPHEMSGGQRQRIAIARALAPEPDLLVADEPVSALDVSVQAQILEIFRHLKVQGRIAMLFISHDIAAVERIADRIAVMYRGRILEEAPTETLISRPRHPYTQALLSAVPSADPSVRRQRIRLRGEPAAATGPLVGCAFASRCPWAEDVCRLETPPLEITRPGHAVACHLVDEGAFEGD